MNIKLYANEEIQAGWKAKGLTTDQAKEELRKTMKVLAGLEKSGDLNGDPTRDLDLDNRVETLEDIIESIQLKIGEWDQ